MTIEEERCIDFMGFSKKDGTQILTISDHLAWVDYDNHSLLLQSKINYYLEYIYSNRINESIHERTRNNVRIQLIMKHKPTMEATMLLRKIEANLEDLGFEFIYGVFDGEGTVTHSP